MKKIKAIVDIDKFFVWLNERWKWILLIFCILGIMFFSYATAINNTQNEVDVIVEAGVPEETIEALYGTQIVEQEFICDQALGAVQLKVATYSRVNYGSLNIEIIDILTNKTIGEESYALENLTDNEYIEITVFDMNNQNGTYIIKITLEDTSAENAITFWKSSTDQLEGDLYVGGIIQEGDLNLRVLSKIEGNITIIAGIMFVVTFMILLILVFLFDNIIGVFFIWVREKWKCISLIFCVLGIVFFAYATVVNNIQDEVSVVLDVGASEDTVGALYGTAIVEQEFASDQVLGAVQLKIATYSRVNYGSLNIEIIDAFSNQIIGQGSYELDDLSDNSYINISVFDIDNQNGTYIIKIKLEDTSAENAITFWKSSTDQLEGDLYVDGIIQEGDLNLKMLSRVEGNITIIVGIIFIVVFLTLLIFVFLRDDTKIEDNKKLIVECFMGGILLICYFVLAKYFHVNIAEKIVVDVAESNITSIVKRSMYVVEIFLAVIIVISISYYIFREKLGDKYIRMMNILIYVVLIVFFVFKANFYQDNVEGFPDESRHISYVVYLFETNELIPEFEQMGTVLLKSDGTYILNDSDTNYLGHPPLYYQIMRLANGITETEDGVYSINTNRLRNFSLGIALIGLILVFYIGFTRLGTSLWHHLIYGLIIVSIPMNAYTMAAVNNDTLSFVGMGIFLLAGLRFYEEKRNYFTYILLALGVFIVSMNKLSAAVIVFVATCAVVINLFMKERNLKFILNRKFYITIPIYLLIVMYYIRSIIEYGTIQPSLEMLNPELYYQSGFYLSVDERIILPFLESVQVFFTNFMATWVGIVSHVGLWKLDLLGLESLGMLLIALLPMAGYCIKYKHKWFCQGMYSGVLFAYLYQFWNAYNSTRGVHGGYQSRYYLCALPCMAFIIVNLFQVVYKKCSDNVIKNKNVLGVISMIIVIGITILLMYEDIIYFLLYFKEYNF